MSGSTEFNLAKTKNWSGLISWSLSCLSVGLGCLGLISLYPNVGLSQLPRAANSSTTAEGPDRPTLKSGSRGAEVTELQATLKLLGYYSDAVDGYYGQTTVNAVSQFQQVAGLTTDGIAGPATWNRLFPPTPELPATTAAVANRPTVSETPNQSTAGFPIPSTITPEPQTPAAAPVTPRPASPVNPNTRPSPPATNSQPAPSSSDPIAFPTLRLGAKGPAVIGLQERLRAAGVFKGSADGVFGAETQAAVKAAQRKFNLEADGVVGPATWAILLR